ncbi:MAG: cache domain-containing protein [Gammaproteobacteria bacterium]|nr:cache domain-containing protein [Gammaproteobacteria bacterium]
MINRLIRAVSANLRYKLLLLVLVPILLVTPTVIGLAAFWTWNYTYKQLYLKVDTDLSVAHDIFLRIQTDRQQELRSLVESYSFRGDFNAGEHAGILDRLNRFQRERNFAFLNLLSADGKQRLLDTGWQDWTGKPSNLLQSAVQEGEPSVGIEIYSNTELAAQSQLLAEENVLPLVETPRAVPTSKRAEDRAMMIRVLQPVLDAQNSVVGLLEGGVLLNHNFPFVDAIRDLVYGPGSLAPGSIGTVTVFLDDVRITTNVPGGSSQRALGTRVSAEVRNAVLENRQIWTNRAFVVNDWYISAYEPIIDVNGESVGMLYAGFLEAPLRQEMLSTIIWLAAILLLGMLLAAAAAIMSARSISRPIESIANVVRATQSGETRRIGGVQSQDEVGELARQFDTMLDTLEENQLRIQRAADELELKVEERTSELSEKNQRLQQTIDLLRETRQQLAMAEKLAALGELTAGVAHEINNPTAVILGNMDVLIAELGEHGESVRIETDLIIEQVYRIRSIVDRLLQYSRPAEYAGYVEEVSVADVLSDTLPLVRHELDRKRVRLTENYATVDPVQINYQELQQVLVNLLLNAAHAVSEGGEITIALLPWQETGVSVHVRDNGMGIPAKQLRRVFDPFYTSGKEQGTGLGLSVSYGIIRRYGGHITVDSSPGEWTEFVVRLRFVAVYNSDDELLQELNMVTSDLAQVAQA